jgi:hypothetical protein
MTVSQVRRQCLDKCTQPLHDDLWNIFAVSSNAWRHVMPRPFASRIVLSAELREQLQTLARAGSTPQSLAFRCRVILQAATDGNPTNQQLADLLDCDRHTVGQWRERFVAQGLAGLQDAPRSGRPRSFSPRRTAVRGHLGQQQDRRT